VRRVRAAILVATLVVALAGCAMTAPSTPGTALRFVALGDSYTIGTSVEPPERFPDQLVAAVAGHGVRLELVANLGVNGYTTANLIQRELPELVPLAPDVVTLLIGVNDVVQRVPIADYEINAAAILDAVLLHVSADRVVVVAIPDYTVTPAGGDFGSPDEQSAAIAAANAVMERVATARGIAWADIWDISREAATDRTLVADDGLHPSGAQYARWVERIAPVVLGLLGAS
jgi:acyl-CoA thioesterase-1